MEWSKFTTQKTTGGRVRLSWSLSIVISILKRILLRQTKNYEAVVVETLNETDKKRN